jgi:hypothetical protein
MARRLAAAAVSFRQRAGQQVVRYREALQELKFALAQAGGSRAFRFSVHLAAIMLQVKQKIKTLLGLRK